MEQQLMLSTIEIVPATMEDVLSKLQVLLSSPLIEQQDVLMNVIKSLFFGLWNFDKMINQHNLNVKISELLTKLPKKSALIFLKALLTHLNQKWNLIDHHRINKFMQLVRYLIVQSLCLAEKGKPSVKKVEQIFKETILHPQLPQNGLLYHFIDIYFGICKDKAQQITLEDLSLFEEILINHSSEHIRLYVIEHIYERYKDYLIQTYGLNLEQLEQHIQNFAAHFLELARKEERETYRKNLYYLVGYAKSQQLSFARYLAIKRQKAVAEQEKRKKKISKGKKREVKQLKEKRKLKKKSSKKTKKILSVRKFGVKNRGQKNTQEL